jgi:hypothetical protein
MNICQLWQLRNKGYPLIQMSLSEHGVHLKAERSDGGTILSYTLMSDEDIAYGLNELISIAEVEEEICGKFKGKV